MKRRNFIKTTAAGSAFIMTPGAFTFGNQPKTISNGKVRKLPQPVVFKDKTYDAFEYTLLLDMPDDSWKSFCRAEHEARDLTWYPGQVDAGDVLFQVIFKNR